MTNPTLIVFTNDRVLTPERPTIPKIFLRTLIYSTGKRGYVIENMFVNLRRERTVEQPFHIWGFGEKTLVRGSGLFIDQTGHAAYHHFTQRATAPDFAFTSGQYELEVFAVRAGRAKPRRLCFVRLTVALGPDEVLEQIGSAYWFDWDPEQNRYYGRFERRVELLIGLNLRGVE